ncbi:MAG: ester cyclase, partial [Solirubrobacterales bacterium]
SDLRFELVRAAHGEDFSAGEWTASMTHSGEFEGLRATGRRVSSAGVDVATLDERGQIVHLVSYYDGAEVMRDLGLLPPRGSRVERALLRVASILPRRS